MTNAPNSGSTGTDADESRPESGWWQDFIRSTPPRTAKLGVVRRDGAPQVTPVWVDLDGEGDDARIVFMTSADSLKGRAILRDGRVSLCLDDERPPFSFLTINGTAETSTDPELLLSWATRIGGRYMGADEAERYGRRNSVPPEMVVWVTPTKVIAMTGVAD